MASNAGRQLPNHCDQRVDQPCVAHGYLHRMMHGSEHRSNCLLTMLFYSSIGTVSFNMVPTGLMAPPSLLSAPSSLETPLTTTSMFPTKQVSIEFRQRNCTQLTAAIGTYWYHSHLSTQYCDGLRGPFVVYDPNDPQASLYDFDDGKDIEFSYFLKTC